MMSANLHCRLATLIPLSLAAVAICWKLSRRGNPRTMEIIPKLQGHRHPIYWFEDGSVIVRAYSNGMVDTQDGIVLFRIHETFLRRHSKVILDRESGDGCNLSIMTIPPALEVQVQDFTSLLAHLYHDTPLSLEAPFQHVAAILRVSSPEQMDLPTVHKLARSYLTAMFPSGPSPFKHPDHLEEALSLALRYNMTSIQKGIYYSLVTTTEFEPNSDATQDQNTQSSTTIALTPTDVVRCRNLLNGIVEHFTPVLFEPPVTPHMACTNLLADKWFPLVIQSAIAGESVYKPLEALEQLKRIDWATEGLCAVCIREKREEWTNEQEEVWDKMNMWLKLDTPSE